MKNLFIVIFLMTSITLLAQEKPQTLTVFLDCDFCSKDYIKKELKQVEFVRDQSYADVHLFFVTQENASGGDHYEIEFIGQKKYINIKDKLSFDTTGETTEDQSRKTTLKYLQVGLMRFWIANGLVDDISVSIKSKKGEKKEAVVDPWNSWSFSVGLNGFFNGQESYSNRSIRGNFSAKRITDKNKFTIRFGLNNNKSVFVYNGSDIISEKQSSYAYGKDVISINEHWSAGVFMHLGNSLYRNKAFYISLKPAIEYNIFPYEKSSKKALAFNYKVGLLHNNYYELTVFGKNNERLWQHGVGVTGSVVKKWGSISSSVNYNSYLHDMSLYSLNVDLNTRLRLFKGFSLNLYGSYGIAHDQLNIAAAGSSLQSLLLQQQQLKSGFNYFSSIGISYSFGSIYNTVINPRFSL